MDKLFLISELLNTLTKMRKLFFVAYLAAKMNRIVVRNTLQKPKPQAYLVLINSP